MSTLITSARDLVAVSYHCFFLMDVPEHGPPVTFPMGSQSFSNGLIMTEPGLSVVATGIADGDAEVTVELHESAPPLEPDAWEEIIEFSRHTPHPRLIVAAPEDESPESLPNLAFRGAGDYRIRIHARGRDTAFDLVPSEVVEHYLLQVWPGEPAPEVVCKQTDECGASLRRSARSPADG